MSSRRHLKSLSLAMPARAGTLCTGRDYAWIPFVITVLLRLFCLQDFLASPFFLPLGGDRGLYYHAALNVYHGNSLPEVFTFMPLYAYLVGGFFRFIGGPNLAALAILQALLDGLTTLLIAGLARRRYGAPAGMIAGLGFAFLGPAVAYSLVTMPVTLGLFWTALTATCTDLWQSSWTRWRTIALGIMLGIGGQILGAFWFMLIPFSIWIAWGYSFSVPRQRWTTGLLVLFCGAACLLPTLIHNVTYGRQWVPLTAHGGLNLYMGNNPSCNGYGTAIPELRHSAEEMTRDSVVLASRLSNQPLTPAETDRYWKRRAWKFWRQEPGNALILLMKKAHRLISIRDFDDTGILRLLPETVRGLRPAVVGFGIIWLLACAGYGLRPYKHRYAGAWIMACCFTMGMLMTFITTRYRLPLAVFLLPAAGGTLALLPTVIKNLRHGINLRWIAGIVGVGMAFIPHTIPNTALVDNVNRANHWCQHGDIPKAMTYALQAVSQQPHAPEAWFILGNAHMSRHEYLPALEAFYHVLRFQPDRTDALFNTARAYECMGDMERAKTLNEHIVELEPRHAKAWFSLAILYRQAGEIENSRDALAEAAGIVGWDHPEIAELPSN